MKWKTLVALLVGALGLGSARSASAGPMTPSKTKMATPKIPIATWQLKNGMQVVFSPHRRVPVVTVQVWYHVGSKNEHKGIRGVAHMFEHLMFKGSKRVRPEQHARMLTALGGSINAFTTNDVTAYHNTLPKQYLAFAMGLEAERMRNLLLTPAALKSEREVVKEEKRQRLENSPIGRSLEAIHALAFRKHPYNWTPAGDIADLQSTKLATYRSFYETYYAPNNATLVVVGDVSEKTVRDLAEKVFGPIQRGKTPPKISAIEPPQKTRRELRASWASQLNVVLGAYHVPPAKHHDIPPLAVLSAILSSGRSSRLYKQLVRRKKLAVSAGGFVRKLEHPGLFYLYALGLPGKSDVNELERSLLDQVALVQKKGVSKTELAKAKNQLTTAQLRGLSTVSGLANQIGESTYLHGDPKAFVDDLQQLAKVTIKDVQRVAKTYLRPDNFSVVLLPAGSGKKAGEKAEGAK